jgi:hypothetical protein
VGRELLDFTLLLDCLTTLLDDEDIFSEEDEEDLPEDELIPLLDEELFPFAPDFGWSYDSNHSSPSHS